jgi:hypothetical protein
MSDQSGLTEGEQLAYYKELCKIQQNYIKALKKPLQEIQNVVTSEDLLALRQEKSTRVLTLPDAKV